MEIQSKWAASVEKFGLKIHIISPVAQLDFMKTLRSAYRGNSILNGLSSYFNKSLNDIFPPDQSETQEKRTLYKNLFALWQLSELLWKKLQKRNQAPNNAYSELEG
jgi:hypothetical protein